MLRPTKPDRHPDGFIEPAPSKLDAGSIAIQGLRHCKIKSPALTPPMVGEWASLLLTAFDYIVPKHPHFIPNQLRTQLRSFPNFIRQLSAAAFVLTLLSACASPSQTPPPSPPPKINLALVLGGGAARGFAHIGVIKVLASHGIVPDLVVGTSAGAVVGALYAGGHSPYALQNLATQLDESVFADWTIPKLGVLNGLTLEDFVNRENKNRPIEKLNLPFAAVATHLQSGTMKVFQSGNTGLAVRASAAVPGLFKPALIDGQSFVDGGLVSPVPIEAAKAMGANYIIAVDISAKPENQPIDSIAAILWQTITIMGGKISANETKGANVLIRPHLPYVKSWDFNARHQSLLEGEKAAQAHINTLVSELTALGWKAQKNQ